MRAGEQKLVLLGDALFAPVVLPPERRQNRRSEEGSVPALVQRGNADDLALVSEDHDAQAVSRAEVFPPGSAPLPRLKGRRHVKAVDQPVPVFPKEVEAVISRDVADGQRHPSRLPPPLWRSLTRRHIA